MTEEHPKRRLTSHVVRGLLLLLGDLEPSGDQRADEMDLARGRSWLRDVAHRAEANLRPRPARRDRLAGDVQ